MFIYIYLCKIAIVPLDIHTYVIYRYIYIRQHNINQVYNSTAQLGENRVSRRMFRIATHLRSNYTTDHQYASMQEPSM